MVKYVRSINIHSHVSEEQLNVCHYFVGWTHCYVASLAKWSRPVEGLLPNHARTLVKLVLSQITTENCFIPHRKTVYFPLTDGLIRITDKETRFFSVGIQSFKNINWERRSNSQARYITGVARI